ncbi:MAG: nucleotidyltransferase domain-containing protein [Oligoflexia bacterium]|nr:nucleotidyltransferase domain-containing protein [Oligoflexia bacterium]
MISPKKIYLFGSRARRDNQERSDYDIAFDATDVSNIDWQNFYFEIKENAPTLCSIDLILIHKAAEELVFQIYKEGIVIYERK